MVRMSKDVKQMVIDRILKELENGVIPWRKKWNGNAPRSYATQKAYRGINTMLLQKGGEYVTFNECKKQGGKVKKGSKSEMVVFYKLFELDEIDINTGKKKIIPFLRFSNVFHISDCENLEPKFDIELHRNNNDPIEAAEETAQKYIKAELIDLQHSDGDRAYYMPSADMIHMPNMELFENSAAYYETLFHELTHSTGAKKRMDRPGITDKMAARSGVIYSKEELVAEMGAAMLSDHTGIDNDIPNHAAYCQSWLRSLKNDTNMLISAASKATKATEYILN